MTLLLLCGVSNAWGAEETYNFTSFTSQSPVTFNATNFNIVFHKGTGTSNPAWTSNQARLYASGYCTITSELLITKIEYNYVINENKNGVKPTIDGATGKTKAGAWDAENKTWTGSDNEVTLSTSGTAGNLGFTSVTVTFAESYKITAISNNETFGTAALSGSKITATPKAGYRVSSEKPFEVTEGTATVTQNDNVFTVSPTTDCTVQINFEAIPKHTVTWNVNGNTSMTNEIEEGTDITFPQEKPGDINGKTFVGWIDEPIAAATDVKPTFITSKTMDKNDITFYAVFAKEEISESTQYTLVSNEDDFVDGVYAIAAKSSSNYYFINGNCETSGLGVEDIGLVNTSITENSFESTLLPTSAIELNVVANNAKEGYYFINYNNEATTYYMYATSAKTSLTWSSTKTTESFEPNFTQNEKTQGCVLLGASGSKVSQNGSTKTSFIRNYASTGAYYNDLYFFKKNNSKKTNYTDYTTFVGYTRDLTDNFGTLCLPCAATIEGAEVYSVESVEYDNENKPSKLYLTKVEGATEKGVPYIIKPKGNQLVATYSGEATETAGNANGLYGSFKKVKIEDGASNYILQNSLWCYVKDGNENYVGANKAYLNLADVKEKSSDAKGDFEMIFDGNVTSINLVPTLTEMGGTMYNLNGMQVNANHKGVVVKNGKKFINK